MTDYQADILASEFEDIDTFEDGGAYLSELHAVNMIELQVKQEAQA